MSWARRLANSSNPPCIARIAPPLARSPAPTLSRRAATSSKIGSKSAGAGKAAATSRTTSPLKASTSIGAGSLPAISATIPALNPSTSNGAAAGGGGANTTGGGPTGAPPPPIATGTGGTPGGGAPGAAAAAGAPPKYILTGCCLCSPTILGSSVSLSRLSPLVNLCCCLSFAAKSPLKALVLLDFLFLLFWAFSKAGGRGTPAPMRCWISKARLEGSSYLSKNPANSG